ncbi:hypothetical protein [Streptomyces albus]|uniref:hypothetical protein n=1 Tax=Streptomyces albus TaxID=1888 RepID=UPI003F1DCD50
MRVRLTTSLALAALALACVPACSAGTEAGNDEPDSTASLPQRGEESGKEQQPLTSSALAKRLLEETDLGSDYERKPEQPNQHEDTTVVGCPAMEKLGGDAATGGSLDFPRKAKASFLYTGGSNSEISEELYSDDTSKLSAGTRRIFDAMASCPTFQVVSGSTAVDIGVRKASAPRAGDEQWSQFLTFSAGGHNSVVKQTAVRKGNILLVVSGSPALVDRHLTKAVSKATTRP